MYLDAGRGIKYRYTQSRGPYVDGATLKGFTNLSLILSAQLDDNLILPLLVGQ